MKHIMLDLETMGNGNRAAIVAIGACEFDPHNTPLVYGQEPSIARTFYEKINLQSSIDAGMQIDASTVLWWMQQSDEARKSTFGGVVISLHDACVALAGFVNQVSAHTMKDAAMWGNGATFDNVIIRSAFKAVGIDPPWSFRNDKCYRTVINLLPENRQPPFERSGTAHNALDDAITQALYLQKVYKELGL